jgi:S-adenosylmethionine-diacylglycerol 3-amino-3-carboxypropyl transferase
MNSISLETADAWARKAASVPIAFSQVREDPMLDEAVLAEVGLGARVFMIASGGDTAAALVAGERVGHLHLVDFNPAQLALTRVKLHLLRHATPNERLALLGHLPMKPAERTQALGKILDTERLLPSVFGTAGSIADLGLDHSGRYEILFHHLRERLRDYREELAQLFTLIDPSEQTRRTAPETRLGAALDDAFDAIMRLENLVCLFGEEATRNARLSFARHFANRTRHALATQPASANPFLAQLLLGRFVDGATYDWMQRSSPPHWPEIVFTCSPALAALTSLPSDSLDFIHLSNILDWLSPAAAAETLSHAWRALRPGGLTFIRQLNSSLDIPAAERRFTWRQDAATLHRADRSFFYRALFIGVK